ncbi:MAG: hypothetical protein HY923_06920 [Elusimicrobia bacterium]|nr:hypothetical protein [Elusimicrobiota bacterium]
MRLWLAAVLLATAAPVFANPMLDLCLPLAPEKCALTKDSKESAYLKCFENVMLKVDVPAEKACASELLHARLHKACGKTDIPTLCAGVKPGENRTMNCLAENRKKLGKRCRKTLDEYNLLEGGERKKGRHSAVSAVRC